MRHTRKVPTSELWTMEPLFHCNVGPCFVSGPPEVASPPDRL